MATNSQIVFLELEGITSLIFEKMFARYTSLHNHSLKFFEVKMMLHEKSGELGSPKVVQVLFLDTTIILWYAEVLDTFVPFP